MEKRIDYFLSKIKAECLRGVKNHILMGNGKN